MRVQMRYFYMGRGSNLVEQFRVVRENGWGSRWQSTLYLAWVDYRRRAKVAS